MSDIILKPSFQAILDRLATAVDSRKGLAGALNWSMRNTHLYGKKFSLAGGYEAQEAWFMGGNAMEPHPRVVIMKPSQIGATEATIRICVAFGAVMKNINVLYVMPTRQMAERNSTIRVAPIIDTCEALNFGRGSKQTTDLRQVGSSFLLFGGTQDSTGGAISTPAEAVILDEYDFMDHVVAGQYMSRLRMATRHPFPDNPEANGIRGVMYWFSTPTLPGYGVAEKLEESNKMRYMCTCTHCGTTQAPNFFDDVVLPGFDADLRTLRKEHLELVNIDGAYLACQKCYRDLTPALLDASTREWVAQKPQVTDLRGFETKPFDFYQKMNIADLLRQLKDSYAYGDWVNFSLGEPYEDASQSFSLEPITSGDAMTSKWIPPERVAREVMSRPVMGIDVGNTSDITIGDVSLDKYGLPDEIWLYYWERYNPQQLAYESKKSADELELSRRIIDLSDMYGIRGKCIDHLPDQTAALKVSWMRNSWQAFYSGETTTARDQLCWESVEDSTVAIDRTKLINHIHSLWNAGKIHLPNMSDSMLHELKTNFRNVKKIRERDTTGLGAPKERWVKVDDSKPDHLIHSLVYMVAAAIVSKSNGKFTVAPKLTGVPIGRSATKPAAAGRTPAGPRLSRDSMKTFGR